MSTMPFLPPDQPDAPAATVAASAFATGSAVRPPALPLMAAMDVQDQLLIVHHDMDRLRTLLADAGETLMENFHELSTMMFRRQNPGMSAPPDGVERRARREGPAPTDSPFREGDASQRRNDRERAEALMLRIVTALQFQDMANQLIEHACNRLRSSADRIARDIMSDDESPEAAFVEVPPMRPNPVTQDEMDAGSVELF